MRFLYGALAALGGLALLGALGWAAFGPLPARSEGDREVIYVIPKGAVQQGARGQGPLGLPSELRLQVGVRDILVLRNEDTEPQQIGPLALAPGQTYRIQFSQPGAIQLACSFHQGIGFVLFVDAPPGPGWERLRWRLGW